MVVFTGHVTVEQKRWLRSTTVQLRSLAFDPAEIQRCAWDSHIVAIEQVSLRLVLSSRYVSTGICLRRAWATDVPATLLTALLLPLGCSSAD